MKYLLVFILAVSLHSCGNYQGHEKIADQITAKTAKKLKLEKDLHLIGTGGGMLDHIRTMGMSFEYFHEITIEEGRELLVYCVQTYLAEINSNERIRPSLEHYPFDYKDVDIRIFVRQPDRDQVPLGSIAVVASIKGKLDYDVREPSPKILKEIHRETYDEAVKLLAKKT